MDVADTSVAVMETAKQLTSSLGQLPLAIVQAASFKRNSPQSIEQILSLLKIPASKLAVVEWENDLSVYEQKSVSAVFSSLWDRLNDSDPVAGHFLKLLSFFDPESIELKIISDGAQKLLTSESQPVIAVSSTGLGNRPAQTKLRLVNKLLKKLHVKGKQRIVPSGSGSNTTDTLTPPKSSITSSLISVMSTPTELWKAVKLLRSMSLVDRHGSDGAVLRIHDLVSFMTREMTKKNDNWAELFDCAVKFIGYVRNDIKDDWSPLCWSEWDRIASHVRSLVLLDNGLQERNMTLVRAATGMASYMSSKGRFNEAMAMFDQMMRIQEIRLGHNHPSTLTTMDSLASVYLSQGKYNEAEALYGRVLASREMVLGAAHPSTLATMDK
ncbi:hypothetical protein SERLA73DRAFT_118227 [Serpula lacrymans var. lacrymans S7.3]|uniref:Uncharacterized protein n=1 Tax=Serpula lacrymans var. lacrymans (strain S7.3) TaxID=936435 RepID=F8QIV1_SERL3|nr:hypothetical protein SERLA73DRAFT_118227 [Serpula lacrymans var. lacrymans S7.3]